MHRLPGSQSAAAMLMLLAAVLLAIRLATVPPPCFDEGWSYSIARNWVELGHYGQLSLGSPVSASMLNIGFPAIAPIALSFKFLGFGVWQGRLPGVLFLLGAMFLMYILARRFHGPAIAAGTLFVLLFLSSFPTTLYGRQAIGEPALLFYLLAGFVSFLYSWEKPALYTPLTIGCWSLALATKLQLLPFLVFSLVGAIAYALYRRSNTVARHAFLCLAGMLPVVLLLWKVQEYLLQDRIMSAPGIFSVTAFVPVASTRITAGFALILFELPTVLGMISEIRGLALEHSPIKGERMTRVVYLILIFGWMVWFVALSNGWRRYLFPPAFLGSMYLASLLHRLTCSYGFLYTIQKSASALILRRFERSQAGALLALMIVALGVSDNARTLYANYAGRADQSLKELLRHAEKSSLFDSGSVVESYEWEVLCFLSCRYHYPPNEVQVELYRRALLEQDLATGYDPLGVDPDYLVVGGMARIWHLYDGSIDQGRFRLLYENARYRLYERVGR